jgi:hypothetical protein
VPALLIDPPAAAWLPKRGPELGEVRVASWDGSHPLLAGMSLRDVVVERAVQRSVQGGQRAPVLHALARGPGNEPLLLASAAGRRYAVLNFALQASNFPQQAGFPAFLANAVDWLTREPRALSYGIGQVRLPGAQARVLDLDGSPVATREVPGATLFEAEHPGMFSALTRDQRLRIAVNVLDARLTEVNAGRFAGSPPAPAAPARALLWRTDPWIVLLALAVVLLAVEWLMYNRRVTL